MKIPKNENRLLAMQLNSQKDFFGWMIFKVFSWLQWVLQKKCVPNSLLKGNIVY